MQSGYIALIGRPNAGKSTLLNQVLGLEHSIVSYKAQTTRDQIAGILTQDNIQIIFLDTPGVHQAKVGGINEYMISQVKYSLESAHLIWYLIDPHSALKHEQCVLTLIKLFSLPVFLLMNKIDKIHSEASKKNLLQFETELLKACHEEKINIIQKQHISGLTAQNTYQLIKKSLAWIPIAPFYYPDPQQLSDRPIKFFVQERIRKALFLLLGDELPYSCAIEIGTFREGKKPIFIQATIYVERQSQKGMVIGHQGLKIKMIGQSARQAIEDLLEEKVFLELQVKVSKNWTKSAVSLMKMGYGRPKKGDL